MNNDYLRSGRKNQKLNTRLKILDAAKELLDRNEDINLEKVADQAKISRATIYRYFPNSALLASEVAINVKTPVIEELLEEVKDMSLEDAMFYIQKHYNKLAQDNENAFRKFLSVALSASLVGKKNLRGARRPLIARAIIDAKSNGLKEKDKRHLRHALSLLSGIEPHIVNTDVNGLSNKQSEELLQWMLKTLLKGLE